MVTKKIFALASVSALAGLMTSVAASGCSTTTTETPNATPDGGGDAGPKKQREAAPEEDADVPACPKEVEVTAEELDKEIGFKPAKKAPGSCSQEDLTTFEANTKDQGLKSWFDLGKDLSESCKSCIFSKDTDANWQVIVGTAEDNGETGFLNFGACFSAEENEECGKSVQFEQFCYNVVCGECAATQTERNKCVQKAGNNPAICGKIAESTAKACPNIQQTIDKCGGALDGIKTLCGSGTAGDAGGQ